MCVCFLFHVLRSYYFVCVSQSVFLLHLSGFLSLFFLTLLVGPSLPSFTFPPLSLLPSPSASFSIHSLSLSRSLSLSPFSLFLKCHIAYSFEPQTTHANHTHTHTLTQTEHTHISPWPRVHWLKSLDPLSSLRGHCVSGHKSLPPDGGEQRQWTREREPCRDRHSNKWLTRVRGRMLSECRAVFQLLFHSILYNNNFLWKNLMCQDLVPPD